MLSGESTSAAHQKYSTELNISVPRKTSRSNHDGNIDKIPTNRYSLIKWTVSRECKGFWRIWPMIHLFIHKVILKKISMQSRP